MCIEKRFIFLPSYRPVYNSLTMAPTTNTNQKEPDPFIVRVTNRFVVLALLSCILLAFAVGRTARVLLILNPEKEWQRLLQAKQNDDDAKDHSIKLPSPTLKEGKVIPHTEYSSKTFDTAKSASINSRWVVTDNGVGQRPKCSDTDGDNCKHAAPVDTAAPTVESNEEEGEHFPEGEHLLIDIANVDSGFLNSEEQLASAMLRLVDECGLTLLSYHCHSMTPMGVSCAGVLLESHVSFHTWPIQGVITLDLFTCGPTQLLPVVPFVEKLFAIPSLSSTSAEKPHMIWAHKYRGFRDLSDDDIAEISDIGLFPLGGMTDYKTQVVTTRTDFQRVDIVDVLRPSEQSWEAYEASLADDGSYESLHPELFAPDRIVFLDGVLQSRRSGDAAYHESLVHPAMFAHENPKRVAIIGGGEGATLREVLKHETVETLVMVEIDAKMVNVSREFLPEWSDCSNLAGSTLDCFDDPRVELYCEDAFQWFIDRFVNGVDTEEQFDVIIMDALDPQIQKNFVEALYNGGPFLKSLPNALSEHGILVGQVGQAPTPQDPREDLSLHRNRVKFIETLIELEFDSVVDYEEMCHSGFSNSWQYIVAFKSFDTRADWFVTEAELNLKIRTRSMPTKNGASPFLYFDGATMLQYMHPSKASEIVFCRSHLSSPICEQQHGFDPEFPNLPLSETLEVNISSLGGSAGRGVFAKKHIPARSYIGLEKLVHSVYMAPSTYSLISSIGSHKIASLWYGEALIVYSYAYGHSFSRHGKIDIMVDSSFQCFINHGCKGTSNVGHKLGVTEESADPEAIDPELLYRYLGKERIYNPFAERQTHFFSSGIPTKDINAGEELFDNYLGMSGNDINGWKEDVVGLKQQCSGAGAGTVE